MVTKANATLRTGALLQRTYSNSWLCSLQEGSTHEMRNGSLLTLVVCAFVLHKFTSVPQLNQSDPLSSICL